MTSNPNLTQYQAKNRTEHMQSDILELMNVNPSITIYDNDQKILLNDFQINDLKTEYGIIVEPGDHVSIQDIYNEL